MSSHRYRECGALGFLVLAAGCSGSGTVELPAGNPTPAAEQQLLAFVTAAGELKTMDPASPTTPAVTVDTGLDAGNSLTYRALLGGTYVGSSNALDNASRPTMVYVKQGKLFRLNLLKGASPMPVPVSSLVDVCGILGPFFDYANSANTRLIVETQGPDGDCDAFADNGGRYLRVDANTTSAGAPISLSDFRIRESIYGTDGSLVGVLVQEGPSSNRVLRRYTADLLSPVTVANLEPATSVDFGGPEPSQTLFYFRLRVAGMPTCLHRYDSGSNQLSACLYAFTASNGPLGLTSEADTTHTYFADGGKALRIAHNGGSAIPIRDVGANFLIDDLRLSPGRVVLNGVDNGTGQFCLETFVRSGGTPAFLQNCGANAITLDAVAGNRIYYTVDNPASGGSDAYLVQEDATGKLTAVNAGWGGFSVSTTRISLGLINLFQDPFHGVLGQSISTPNPNFNVEAYSYDAQTGAPLRTLGITANATASVSFAFGRYRLAEVTIFRYDPGNPSGGTFDTDVYFADTLTAGSLRPLSQTVGAPDSVVF